MTIFKAIYAKYKSSLLFRLVSQSMLLIAVYVGIQTWQSLNQIRGQAPIILDQTMNGELIKLTEYQSKPLIIYFWSEWCPICRYQSATMNELAKDYQVLSISTFAENREVVEKYLQDENINMTVVFDENNEWANLYNVTAVPTSFIIDSKGNIRFVEKGFTTSIGLKLRLWWAD